MQEETMAWDPVTLNHPLGWVPRLYILLLFLILLVAIARVLRLAWALSSFSVRRQVSVKHLADGALDQSKLVSSALGNNFEKSALEHSASDSNSKLDSEMVRTLERADVRFCYLWQLRMNDVGALKRSVYLLLLASAFVMFDGFVDIFRGIAIVKGTGIGALSGGLAEIGLLLTVGFALATAVYLMSICFEGMLLLRENRWNYFYSGQKQK